MKIATWNVNGIRAREAQVLEWINRDRPDIVCLQELKALPEQVPASLKGMQDYSIYWHGMRAYSGVGLWIRNGLFPSEPRFGHPAFDHEARIVTAQLGRLVVGSVYVPNGGKDFQAKIRFLQFMREYVQEAHAGGLQVILCGDINVALSDRDVHPKERNPETIGQRPEERDLLAGILSQGLVDVGRMMDPENPGLFTWWPPWRQMRQRNIGWRLDYVLASSPLGERVERSEVLAQVGTSDHAPVVAELSLP